MLSSYQVGMELRSGPPPPPRGKRAVPTYQDDHRMEVISRSSLHFSVCILASPFLCILGHEIITPQIVVVVDS